LNDYRDDTTNKQIDLIPSIVALIAKAGLFTDLPYLGYQLNNSNNLNNLNGTLSSEQVESMLSDTTTRNLFISDFNIYLSNLTSYLSELESKLFSQGLYEIGSVVNSTLVKGYLSAVIDDSKVSDELKTVICSNAAKHKSIENILIACNQESSILGEIYPKIIIFIVTYFMFHVDFRFVHISFTTRYSNFKLDQLFTNSIL
jgi:cobalamin biosynthesis Mg chelatase CobN